MTVNYDYDSAAEFDRYQTYAWMKHASGTQDGVKHSIPTGGPFDKRARAAADQNLAEKGLQLTQDSPDLLVIYHIGTQEKIQATSYGYSYYPYSYGYYGHRVDIYQYTEGTLVLDLVDAETDQLVWRGYVTDTIQHNPDPQRVEARLDEAFHRMLTNYPPRP